MTGRKTQLALLELADDEFNDGELPVNLVVPDITAMPPPQAIENLKKLKRFGILNTDTLLSLVAQAPIDPINLMGTLLNIMPDGWAFSAFDFSMLRVLSRNKIKAVSAALRVDLMGDTIMSLALNKAGQLTAFKQLEVTPSPDMLDKIQALCDETVAAALRETIK